MKYSINDMFPELERARIITAMFKILDELCPVGASISIRDLRKPMCEVVGYHTSDNALRTILHKLECYGQMMSENRKEETITIDAYEANFWGNMNIVEHGDGTATVKSLYSKPYEIFDYKITRIPRRGGGCSIIIEGKRKIQVTRKYYIRQA